MDDLANKVICRSPRAACKELADGAGAVILHLESGAYHGLNQIGTLIWNLLEEDSSFEDLLAGLRSALEDAPPNLAEDVGAYLGDLAQRDLIILE